MRYALAVVALLLAVACAPDRRGEETLTVLAAASLTDVFTRIAMAFEASHHGVDVALSFAGSQTVVTQLAAGAPADVLATADEVSMARARDLGLVGDPVDFASNRLVVVTPRANPAAVDDPADLAAPGVRLVLAAPQVPAGRYARQALADYGIGQAALGNVVSEEEDVKGVLAKVLSGEADAGVVYATDVTAAVVPRLRTLPLDGTDVVIRYPIVVTSETDAAVLARDFVAAVTGEPGREVLADAGFGPP